jgi:outer membrane protein insertion porin family
LKSTIDGKYYTPLVGDVVGLVHLQSGILNKVGSDLRMLDHFFMGPNLVRGFAPAGFGPRDLTYGTTNDALGGSMYWGSSVEFQTPLYFLPREIGIKFAVFADAGSLWDYQGPTTGSAPVGSPVQTVQVGLDKFSDVRSSIGAGLIWDSPLGPLRVDVAYPITKYCEMGICDRTQIFRFSGGAKF